MKIEVLCFAALKDAAGSATLEVEVPEEGTAGDLRIAVAHTAPALAPLLGSVAVAVNRRLAADRHPVRQGDEVALLPPVSGG